MPAEFLDFVPSSNNSTFVSSTQNAPLRIETESSLDYKKSQHSVSIHRRILADKCLNSKFPETFNSKNPTIKNESIHYDSFINANIKNERNIESPVGNSKTKKSNKPSSPSSIVKKKRKSWAPLYLVPRNFDKKKWISLLNSNNSTFSTTKDVKAPIALAKNSTSDFISLQTFCRKNNLLDPSYVVPMSMATSSTFTCRCSVLVDHSNFVQYLETIGVEATLEQSKIIAARKMRERLDKLLTELKKSKLKCIKKKRLCDVRVPRLNQNNFKCVIKIEPDERKVDISNFGENDISVSLNNKENLENLQNFMLKKEEEEEEENKDQSLMEREILNDPVQRIRRSKDWIESTTPVKLKPLNISIEDYKKRFEKNATTLGEQLSGYHQQMLASFNFDLRKDIAERVDKLTENLDRKNPEPFLIDQILVQLDEILALIDMQVNNTLFVAHNGRYIRVIHIDTIPGIVEVEEGHDYVNLGFNALYRVIDKLKKIIS